MNKLFQPDEAFLSFDLGTQGFSAIYTRPGTDDKPVHLLCNEYGKVDGLLGK